MEKIKEYLKNGEYVEIQVSANMEKLNEIIEYINSSKEQTNDKD